MTPELASFPIALALTVLLGSWVFAALGRREGISATRSLIAMLVIATGALSGAKLFSLVEEPRWPFAVEELTRGYRYPGGVLGLLLWLPLARRILPVHVTIVGLADLLAPPTALAMAVIRINCFLQGCCIGEICFLPWCFSFPPDSPAWLRQFSEGLIGAGAAQSLPVHPLQLYFMGASVWVFLVLLRLSAAPHRPGAIFLWFLALHESLKFTLEFLRFPRVDSVQLASLALALLGWTGLVLLQLSRRERAMIVREDAR